LVEDGSQAQWFIDGEAAFEVIASSIENAKSEVYFVLFCKHIIYTIHASVYSF
jgi:phosphatidylserine/phosphatidylglycerophosphate/cardiolipin synthase-like enzyme